MQPKASSVSLSSAATRWLAALLALIVLVGPLSSALHFLIVRHGVCPEHGELTHLGPDGRTVHPRLPAESAAFEAPQSAPAPHSDEHCALAALPPSPSAPLEPASFVEPARVAQPPRKSEALDTAHRQVPALALAPKASPPSAHS